MVRKLLGSNKHEQKDRVPGDGEGSGSFIELVGMVVFALVFALVVQAFLVKPFRIPSESMVPTMEIGHRLLTDRVTMRFRDPEIGDILVFKPPAGADSGVCGIAHDDKSACPKPETERLDINFIKRVVAGPGDRLKIIKGHVYLDGKRQDESFIRPDAICEICNLPKEIRIPRGHYFMMGDNRGASDDSRIWGPIPEAAVVGVARLTYWPPNRIGGL